MSETSAMVRDSATRLFAAHCTAQVHEQAEAGNWATALWQHCEAAGLPLAATPAPDETPDLRTAAAVIRASAAHAVPLPLAETMLAHMMLAQGAIVAPTGPLTIAPVLDQPLPHLTRINGAWRLTGTLDRVPWARAAGFAAVLAREKAAIRTVLFAQPPIAAPGWNYAREPRDRIQLDAVPSEHIVVGREALGWQPATLQLWGALFRAMAMAGAMERVLEMTLDYAKQRVQFGRAIGKFQAVQQQIAVLASHVAATNAAVQGAINASDNVPAPFEIAAAKLRASEAAGVVSEIAHQVHGAMGFTREHALHRTTRRLWSWRDEFGDEAAWSAMIGRLVCGQGGEQLWPFLTRR